MNPSRFSARCHAPVCLPILGRESVKPFTTQSCRVAAAVVVVFGSSRTSGHATAGPIPLLLSLMQGSSPAAGAARQRSMLAAASVWCIVDCNRVRASRSPGSGLVMAQTPAFGADKLADGGVSAVGGHPKSTRQFPRPLPTRMPQPGDSASALIGLMCLMGCSYHDAQNTLLRARFVRLCEEERSHKVPAGLLDASTWLSSLWLLNYLPTCLPGRARRHESSRERMLLLVGSGGNACGVGEASTPHARSPRTPRLGSRLLQPGMHQTRGGIACVHRHSGYAWEWRRW